MSLQSIITCQVIPGLQTVDLLGIQNVLQDTLAGRIRISLRDADVKNLFTLEINRLNNYKSISLKQTTIDFVKNFPIQNFAPMYVENRLMAIMRGESSIVLSFDGISDIWIYIYPTKATITILNEQTIILSTDGVMQLRGLEDNIPFLSFIVRNLHDMLTFKKPVEEKIEF